MKKSCYGLLLVCAITFGLSLSGCSDTNALKYSFDSFSFADRLFYDSDCVSNSSCHWRHQRGQFRVDFYQPESGLSIDSSLLDLDDNNILLSCPNGTRFNIFDTSSSSYYQFYTSNLLNVPYVGTPPSDLSTNNMYYPSCSYSYDSLYATETNLSNGNILQVADFAEMFFDIGDPGYSSGKLRYMSVPLTLSSNFDVIPSGTLLEFDFGLVQKSANNFPFISSSFNHNLEFSYFTSPSSSSSFADSFVSDVSSCSIDTNYRFTIRSNELYEDYLGFNVHCSFTAPSDIYYFRPSIVLDSSSYFLEYDYHGIYFSGSFLTTNNDSTWSGTLANPIPSGSDLTSAPGYIQLYGYPDDGVVTCVPGDFLCELSHLFDFSTLNPFAPMFDLFTDNSSCSSIPIIAGMLNSNETTYCPWFSSTTRNILTPVLGLVSSMLIFGFFVRWLGSSSGNMFEDQTSHKWGNTQIKSKGGKH